MKTTKRALSLILALVVVLSIAVPAFAADTSATITTYTDTKTVFKGSAYEESTVWFGIAWSSKNFTIKRSSINISPGTTGATLKALRKTCDIHLSEGMNGKTRETSQEGGYSYRMELRVSNPGTAKISFKIGNKTYKFKVNVLEYQNQVKSFKITGVGDGKNLASLTKYTITPETVYLNQTVKNAKFSVTAASGWKVRSIGVEDETAKLYRGFENNRDGVTSGKINWGKLYANHNYGVYLTLYNAENNFTSYITYHVKGINAA